MKCRVLAIYVFGWLMCVCVFVCLFVYLFVLQSQLDRNTNEVLQCYVRPIQVEVYWMLIIAASYTHTHVSNWIELNCIVSYRIVWHSNLQGNKHTWMVLFLFGCLCSHFIFSHISFGRTYCTIHNTHISLTKLLILSTQLHPTTALHEHSQSQSHFLHVPSDSKRK